MIGIDLVVGYMAAYAVRKAQRAGKRMDADVDRVLDAGLERLHEVVTEKLGDDPAVQKLQHEAEAGVASSRTVQRMVLAVEDAAEADGDFADRLREALSELVARDDGGRASGVVRQIAIADRGSTINQAGRDLIQLVDGPRE
jgi:hypothetical protein